MNFARGCLVLPVAICNLLIVAAGGLAVIAISDHAAPVVMVVGAVLAFVIIALAIILPRGYIVFAEWSVVSQHVRSTLRLLQLEVSEFNCRFTIAKTGTSIRVQPLGQLSCISFTFGEGGSERERYVVATVIKYQRFKVQ